MKFSLRSFLLFLSALIVPLSSATCQDSKTEKKIKVVLDDGSGAKIVMDTIFTNSQLPDSVVLKNGKVIYFAENIKEVKEGKSPEKLLMTVISTGGDEKDKEQTIITTYENPDKTSKANAGAKHSYSYSSSGNSEGKSVRQTVIIADDDKDLTTGTQKVIIIKDGKVMKEETDKDFDTLEKLENSDNHAEMTKYIIAKDGVVVTVESKDEAKAKDLIKEIENQLCVSKEDNEKKGTVKTQTRVTVKK